MKFLEGLQLGIYIDQYRTGRDRVDGFSLEHPKIIGGSPDELAALQKIHLACQTLNMIQQVIRNITENGLGAVKFFQRAKGDQPIAAADIQQRPASFQADMA